MFGVPRAPLLLGLAGLIPFVWGAISYLVPSLATWGAGLFGPRNVSLFVQLSYGSIILSFMSGVLWGFATKTCRAQAAVGYALATLPALWIFLAPAIGPTSGLMNLIFGFIGVLILDFAFTTWGLTPVWWMRLRVLLTTIVVGSLSIGVLF